MNQSRNVEFVEAPGAAPAFSPVSVEMRLAASDMGTWPDSLLIARLKCCPPDEQALDALIARYWKPLFAQCRMMVLDSDQADRLAQAAWQHILSKRHALHESGDIWADLVRTAIRLWRTHDKLAGPGGVVTAPGHRGFGVSKTSGGGAGFFPEEIISNEPDALPRNEQVRLAQDIDVALGKMTQPEREAFLARHLGRS
jgi:DNA-directed RNA polymerase specialized sigma24 family protein